MRRLLPSSPVVTPIHPHDPPPEWASSVVVDAATWQVRRALLTRCTPEGLRLVDVGARHGAPELVAWCTTHLWGSVPAPIDGALEARCPGCLANIDATNRRAWFLRHYGLRIWLRLIAVGVNGVRG